MAGDERAIPAPVTSPETEAFWDAARDGRFLLRWCTRCERPHWYPRALCPFCLGSEMEWREASGQGEIYAFSVMRRAPQVYTVAYVTLREGPTMLTNIRGCDPDQLRIGQPVRVVFAPSEGGPPVPMFTPL